MSKKRTSKIITVLIGILLIGIVYRVAAFSWNTRLQGDVNLFALTARELVNHGRLFYPMKYEYSDQIDYLTLNHPATQHPPLFPVLASVLGWLTGSDDTFLFLKIASFSVGVLLLVVIAVLGIRHGYNTQTALALLFVSISPIITDYSANGSPYILSALAIILGTYLISQFRYDLLSHYVLVAVLSAVGLLTHGAMVAVPAAFSLVWLFNIKRLRWTGVLLTATLGLLLLSPWMLWTYSHFGRPFYTYSTLYLEMQWGFAAEGVFEDVVTTSMIGEADEQFFLAYIPHVLVAYLLFWVGMFLEIGPFAILLAVAGGWSLWRTHKSQTVLAMLPILIYTLLPAFTTILRLRYLVPILPLIYLIAAWGFFKLYPRYRRLAIIGLMGTLIWFVPQYLDFPPTRYYLNDALLAERHQHMVDLSLALRTHEEGVVLAHASHLVGGVETVYWHRFPFVRGRYHSPIVHEAYPGEILHTLAEDFDVRYIWADNTTIEHIQMLFPEAEVILSSGPFFVLERPQGL